MDWLDFFDIIVEIKQENALTFSQKCVTLQMNKCKLFVF